MIRSRYKMGKIVFFKIYTNFMINKINVMLLLHRCTYCVQNRTFQVEGYGIYVCFFKRRLLLFSCIATIAVKITAVLLSAVTVIVTVTVTLFHYCYYGVMCIFPLFSVHFTPRLFFSIHIEKLISPTSYGKCIKQTINFNWKFSHEYFEIVSFFRGKFHRTFFFLCHH